MPPIVYGNNGNLDAGSNKVVGNLLSDNTVNTTGWEDMLLWIAAIVNPGTLNVKVLVSHGDAQGYVIPTNYGPFVAGDYNVFRLPSGIFAATYFRLVYAVTVDNIFVRSGVTGVKR